MRRRRDGRRTRVDVLVVTGLVVVLVGRVVVDEARAAIEACATAPATPGDRRTTRPGADDDDDDDDDARFRVRVAAFNAEWLFDGVDDVSASPYSGGSATGAARAHVDAVADVIAAMDADVVVVVETETCETLADAGRVDTTTSSVGGSGSGAYARYLVPGTDTATAQQVGLLTKIDPVSDLYRVETRGEYDEASSACGYSGQKDSAVSKHFVARILVGQTYVSIIGAHLKAFPTSASSCAQREAQAEVLRGIVRERYEAGDAVLVMGDLNDYSDETADASSNTPTSRVLARLRDFDDDGIDELEEAGAEIAQSERYTWASGSNNAKVDYILYTKRDIRVIDAVIRHDLVTSSVSDHYPVVATLEISQGTEEEEEEEEQEQEEQNQASGTGTSSGERIATTRARVLVHLLSVILVLTC
jgi:endonuclease/exonuclease/phosphatase family metal-dependent hydrolase